MILRVSTPGDIDELFFDLREKDLEIIESMGGMVEARKVVDNLLEIFPHQVFITDDGRVAALWIMMRRWTGVIEVVAYTGNETEKNKVGFFKACVRGIDYIADHLYAHKIECLVWGDYYRSIKWLVRLGFQKEGFMRQHGPDKSDATMMGRVL